MLLFEVVFAAASSRFQHVSPARPISYIESFQCPTLLYKLILYVILLSSHFHISSSWSQLTLKNSSHRLGMPKAADIPKVSTVHGFAFQAHAMHFLSTTSALLIGAYIHKVQRVKSFATRAVLRDLLHSPSPSDIGGGRDAESLHPKMKILRMSTPLQTRCLYEHSCLHNTWEFVLVKKIHSFLTWIILPQTTCIKPQSFLPPF